jgi:hypothetical protein
MREREEYPLFVMFVLAVCVPLVVVVVWWFARMNTFNSR